MLAVQGVQAQTGRGAELLAKVAGELDAMGCYEVRFEVVMGDEALCGEYMVDGELYRLQLLGAEVYGEKGQRYEVNHSRGEVTIVPVDNGSATLIDNPARVFEVLQSGYAAELQSEADGRAEILLTPKDAKSRERITVSVTTSPLRPLEILYDYDGESVSIRILAVEASTEPLPTFDAARYEGYETIDFR